MYLSRIEINPRRRETMRALAALQSFHAVITKTLDGCSGKSGYDGVRDLLWRIDSMNRDGRSAIYVLMQSVRPPDFNPLIRQFGWPDDEKPERRGEIRDYASFLSGLWAGQCWRFRLRANPVHSVVGAEEGGKRGDLKAHVTVGRQKKWLVDRQERLGFRILPLDAWRPGRDSAQTAYDGSIEEATGEDLKGASITHIDKKQSGEGEKLADKLALEVMHRETVNFFKFDRDNPQKKHRLTLSMVTFEGLLEIKDAARLADHMRKGVGRAKAYGCGLLTLAPAQR